MDWKHEEDTTFPPDCSDGKCLKCYKCYKEYVAVKMTGKLDR